MNREQIAKNLVQTFMGGLGENEIQKMIKNNYIPFQYKGKTYRIRKATWEEQEELNKARLKKFNELLDDKNYLFREQLVEKYKKKGVDIEKMDNAVKSISATINSLRIKATESENEAVKQSTAKQIEDLMQEQALIVMKKTDLLSYSLEDAIIFYVNGYLAYQILEIKKVNDEKGKAEPAKWIKVFDTYKDFKEYKDIDLTNKALRYLDFLVYYEAE